MVRYQEQCFLPEIPDAVSDAADAVPQTVLVVVSDHQFLPDLVEKNSLYAYTWPTYLM